MRRPKLFLDSSICIDAAKEIVPPDKWAQVWRYLSKSYRYLISPLTLAELLVGIGRGKTEYFDTNRKALRILRSTLKRKRFLRLPGHFVRETLFGDSSRKPRFEPEDFTRWMEIVLRAPDKAALESGRVNLPYQFRQTFGFDFGHIDQELQKGKDEHAHLLQHLREGKLVRPSVNVWAAAVLDRLNVQQNSTNNSKLFNQLDAAFHFDQSLWKLAETSSYDFAKHETDWLDRQQLYYLCDQEIYFATGDDQLRERTAGSEQAKRILTWAELCSLARVP